MKKSLFLMAVVVSLSPSVQAQSCNNVFLNSGLVSRVKNTVIDSLSLDFKNPGSPHQVFTPSKAEVFWAEKAQEMKNQKDAVALTNEIFDGISYVSSSEWKKVADVALPAVLRRVEALDNIGALDAAAVYSIFGKQLERVGNFKDQTYKQILDLHLGETSGSPWRVVENADIFNIMKKREAVQYDLQREVTGSAAEQIYMAMQLPVQASEGIAYKVLRSTDRSVVLVMAKEVATNTFSAHLSVDSRSDKFYSNNEKVYRIQITEPPMGQDFFNHQFSSAQVTQLMRGSLAVANQSYVIYQVTAMKEDGTAFADILSVADHRTRTLDVTAPKRVLDIIIEVPKNPTAYQGGETVSIIKNNDAAMIHFRKQQRELARRENLGVIGRFFEDLFAE